jgi:hypothetical protein
VTPAEYVADDELDELYFRVDLPNEHELQAAVLAELPEPERSELAALFAKDERNRARRAASREAETTARDSSDRLDRLAEARAEARAMVERDELPAFVLGALDMVEKAFREGPIPSDEQLNAMSDEQEAAWAGVPPPRPQTLELVAPLVRRTVAPSRQPRARPREHRARARSPGRRSADDDPEPEPLTARAEAAA